MKSATQVALEAGNSPQIIFQHYRELLRPKDATTWFSITPAEDGKIVYIEAPNADQSEAKDPSRPPRKWRRADATSSLPETGWFFCRPAALLARCRPLRVCSSLAPDGTAKSLRHFPTLIRLQPPEAGNSPQIIFQHYRELVRPKDATSWFSITPDDDGKIIYIEVPKDGEHASAQPAKAEVVA